jgi:hypothetical protein
MQAAKIALHDAGGSSRSFFLIAAFLRPELEVYDSIESSGINAASITDSPEGVRSYKKKIMMAYSK